MPTRALLGFALLVGLLHVLDRRDPRTALVSEFAFPGLLQRLWLGTLLMSLLPLSTLSRQRATQAGLGGENPSVVITRRSASRPTRTERRV